MRLKDINAWVDDARHEDVDETYRDVAMRMEENDDLYEVGFDGPEAAEGLSPEQEAFLAWCDQHVDWLFGRTMINKADAEMIKAHWAKAQL